VNKTITTHPVRQQTSLRALSVTGALTLLGCLVVNILIRTIAVTFFGVSAAFAPLQLPTIIGSTIIYLLLAIAAFLLVSRMSSHPARVYRILAGCCLLISLLFPLAALTGVFPTPGMTTHIFWSMIAMHVLSAAIVIGLLPLATHHTGAARR